MRADLHARLRSRPHVSLFIAGNKCGCPPGPHVPDAAGDMALAGLPGPGRKPGCPEMSPGSFGSHGLLVVV